MNKKLVRIICVILAALLLGSVLFGAISTLRAGAVASQSALNSLKKQQTEIKQKMQDIKAKINSLEYDQSAAIAKKNVLDEQIELTQQEIDNITDQITEYDVLIAEQAEVVKEAQWKEDEQWTLYKARMRAMEENGVVSYYAIIFGASSFSDLLTRIDTISDIMKYDEEIYQNLVKVREEKEEAKAELEKVQAEQIEKVGELEEAQVELENQVEEANLLIEQLEAQMESYDQLYEEEAAEAERIQQSIKKMEKELAAASASVVKGTGTFVWPSASSRIVTSKFGTRLHPVYKTYKTHYGIDIGAGYGTSVLAADGGTVTTATYSSSYGNYIVISHGNGYTTLYAHLSKILVKKGDTVKQSQVIGKVGSTGVSTGPHIHFEISKNGTRINPLQFYSNYVVKE